MASYYTTEEYKALTESDAPKSPKRMLRVLDTQMMPNGTERKRSFGFHWPQIKENEGQSDR